MGRPSGTASSKQTNLKARQGRISEQFQTRKDTQPVLQSAKKVVSDDASAHWSRVKTEKLNKPNNATLESPDKYANDNKAAKALLAKLAGNEPRFHQEDLSVADKLLRLFDLTSDYGPCAGLSRLQRWERANKLGKNPPGEVKDLLTTPMGETDRYKWCYLGSSM